MANRLPGAQRFCSPSGGIHTSGLATRVAPNNNGRLGYTLKVPLLAFLKPQGQGWQVDQQALERVVRTVRDNPRPLLLYLFQPTLASMPRLSRYWLKTRTTWDAQPVHGPGRLLWAQPVYPWSVARTDNPLTLYRGQVIHALLQRLCTLPDDARHRIKGIQPAG